MKKIMFGYTETVESRQCRNCEKRGTLECPNSSFCRSTINKPYFKGKLRPLTLRERFTRWKFLRKWEKKHKNWKEYRHKRRRRAEALKKAGFEKRYE